MDLFHILPREEWERVRRGVSYAPASLRTEGFIHFSYDRQLLATAARHFRGQTDLMVLSVRRDRVRGELRDEEANGELFPHLYGPLNLDAVVDAVELSRWRSGR